MLRFTRLRLSGFKSFVDPVEIAIAPGLSGIVGPNGCGKSNLVEALRWVMGESSARQMRGGEMEDVIFGGSIGRPARNLAEVCIELEGDRGDIPPPFGAHAEARAETRSMGRGGGGVGGGAGEGGGDGAVELEIRRRIDRGKGSLYRVNGREARARDVQLLFADAASGARSGAMVTQGQVTQLILAKPSERRLLLDEAAGISGIYPRRHEAELRLRAAEANLERLDDILATLGTQLDNIRKQARQAARYRTICEQIRKTEAALLRARLAAAEAEAEEAERARAAANAAVTEATGRAAVCATAQAEAAAALPALRANEAEALAALHALGVARDALEEETCRIEAERGSSRRRLEQLRGDVRRARTLAEDAGGNLDRLAAERQRLLAAGEGEETILAAAERRLAEAETAVAEFDGRLIELGEAISADEAGRAALDRTLAELDDGLRRLDVRAAEGERQRKALSGQAAALPDPDAAETAAVEAEAALERARAAAETAESRRAAFAAGEADARDALHEADALLAPIRAEIAALTKTIAAGGSRGGPRLIDALDAAPGWEAALAAALGEDLSASTDPDQPAHWRALPPLEGAAALPEGVVRLADHVGGPDAVGRRLDQVGIVADAAEADRLQPDLRPGQRLVGRDGGLWRWDGLTVRAGAPNAAAIMLEQRNRLAALRGQLPELEVARGAAALRAGEAAAAAAGAREAERAARDQLRAAEVAQRRAAEVRADLRQRLAQINARVAAVAEAAAAAAGEREDLLRRSDAAAAAHAALPDPSLDRAAQGRLREDLNRARATERERRTDLDAVRRDAHGRRRRLETIARDADAWTERRDAAAAQIAELSGREKVEQTELARLDAAPGEIENRRQALLDEMQAAAAGRQAAGDRVCLAETALAEADRALRAAEKELTEAREQRVRGEAALAQAERAQRETVALIAERLGVPVAALLEMAEADPRGEPGDGSGVGADVAPNSIGAGTEAAERRLERLKRERETMGPVNLRAEDEAAEVAAKIAELTGQRQDLTEAIAKLRRGIGDLDREGRERLLASFSEVNRHFGELFTHLFGGGRAHLSLSDSDDPLEAGLEIMACPPGKKLQVLSLLSGGEQALTALGLRFAVFLTNPAPICVLDEVDAPLDDANVDRFCSLLADMSKSGTRFLVITHHRMTMARMDRLYGVTMVERGVSQLVSVDLQRAEALRDTA